ncbi:MAG: SGNH/GDSL hydrolase family protein [Verrucomicrobiota bacterium]
MGYSSHPVEGGRGPKMAKKILLLLSSLLVAVLILEGILRVLQDSPTFMNPLSSFHRGDEELGWVGVADFSARFERPDFDVIVRMDGSGFRAKGAEVVPSEGAEEVFVLGDSFVWGWGVEEGEVVTDVLQDELGPGYVVGNFGVNAWGTAQAYLLLRRMVEEEERLPKRVYLMVFRNDFSDNLDSSKGARPFIEVGDEGAVLVNSPVERVFGGSVKALQRNSYLLSVLSYLNNQMKMARRQKELEEKVIRGGKSGRVVGGEAREAMAYVLGEMKAFCDGRGIAFSVVYIPQIEDFVKDDAPYRAALMEICEGKGVPFVDLLEPMRDEGVGFYFPGDGHWNRAGHQRAGEILARNVGGSHPVR